MQIDDLQRKDRGVELRVVTPQGDLDRTRDDGFDQIEVIDEKAEPRTHGLRPHEDNRRNAFARTAAPIHQGPSRSSPRSGHTCQLRKGLVPDASLPGQDR